MIGENRQELHAGAGVFFVLFGHHARNLRDVSEIVHDPRGEELAQRHGAKYRMGPGQSELRVRQSPAAKDLQVFGSELREFVEQRVQRAADVARPMTKPVVSIEWTVFTRQDDARANHPVGFFAVDEVPDDVERAESVWPLASANPRIREAVEKRTHRRGCPAENSRRLFNVESHRLSPDVQVTAPRTIPPGTPPTPGPGSRIATRGSSRQSRMACTPPRGTCRTAPARRRLSQPRPPGSSHR